VTAISSQKGNFVLPWRMYYQEVASIFLLSVPFHNDLIIIIIIIIIIVIPSFCLYDVLILISF
jgi:hypothetical protein